MTTRDAFMAYLRTGAEFRAAGETSAAAGLDLVPTEFAAELATELKQHAVLAADFTRVETGHGRPMLVPVRKVAAVPAANPQTENTAVPDSGTDAGADAVFSQRTLHAFALTSGTHKVSAQLVADSAFPIDAVLREFAAERIGRSLSALSVSGTGSSQPQGVITAATAAGAWSAGNSGGYVSLTAAQAVYVDGTSTTELTSARPRCGRWCGPLTPPTTAARSGTSTVPSTRRSAGSPTARAPR